MRKDGTTPMTLAGLIQQESGLDARESARLADAWMADVLAELQTSGISVIRGLGTFTMTEAGLRFEQDDDFPSLSDFPAVEGYSAALASAATVVPSASDGTGPSTESHGTTSDVVSGDTTSVQRDDVTDEHADFLVGAGPEEHSEPSAGTPGEESMDSAADVDADNRKDDPTHDATADQEDDAAQESTDLSEPDDHHDEPQADESADDTDSPQGDAWASGIEQAIEQADSRIEADGGSADPDGPVFTREEAPSNVDEPSDTSEPSPGAAAIHRPPEGQDDEPTAVATESSEESGAKAVPAPAHSRSPRRYERSQSGSSRTALLAIAIVVLIVASALIYRFVVAPPEDEPAMAAAQEDVQTASDDSTDAMAAAGDPAASDSTMGPMNASTSDSTMTPAQEPPTATAPVSTVDAITKGMGGYTLVVSSTLNESTARAELNNYAALGWPMGVLAYETEDLTRYRIAVGHYSTAAEADAARNQFADNLPEGTWVLSVR